MSKANTRKSTTTTKASEPSKSEATRKAIEAVIRTVSQLHGTEHRPEWDKLRKEIGELLDA